MPTLWIAIALLGQHYPFTPLPTHLTPESRPENHYLRDCLGVLMCLVVAPALPFVLKWLGWY